jgi:hypothetical protein
MIKGTAVRIAVAGVIAAAALGAGVATTAHQPRTGTVWANGGGIPPRMPDDPPPLPGDDTDPPRPVKPGCPNCFI